MSVKPPGPYTLLKISGEDAAEYLQGQLSNDVSQLDKSWQYSGLCNPKGRLLAILRLWRQQHAFYALVSSDLAANVLQRLSMYVLRSKVRIETLEQARVYCFESRDQLCHFDHQLVQQSAAPEHAVDSRIDDNGNAVFALHANCGLLYVCDQSVAPPADDNELAGRWRDNCIATGVAEITSPTIEKFVPQMVNLDLIGGISFKKGCYTGQEIVARMHYLGNLKQRMLLCSVAGTGRHTLEAGQKVYSDADLSKPSGTLVSISQNGERVLAVLRLANLQQPHFLQNGQSLSVASQQPYDVDITMAG